MLHVLSDVGTGNGQNESVRGVEEEVDEGPVWKRTRQLLRRKEAKKEGRDSLQKLSVSVVQLNSVLLPELLRLMRWGPSEVTGFELRSVFVPSPSKVEKEEVSSSLPSSPLPSRPTYFSPRPTTAD